MRHAFALMILLAAFHPAGFAGTYDIKQMTPAIERAIAGRQARYEQLQSFKAKGAIGEDRQGYVQPLAGAGELSVLAQAENADRRVIYQAIVDQNGLGAAGMAQVEAAFATVQREKARPGDSVQNASGEWVKK